MLIYLNLLDGEEEKTAFAEIYNDNLSYMLQIANRFFADKARAEDAVHNAFLVVARDFKKFFQISCPERTPYLVTIVKNKCRDILRAERKYAEITRDEEDTTIAEPSPELDGVAEEYRRAVELIYKLPDSFREVLEYRLIFGLNNVETAKHLGISQDLASKRYNRGRVLVMKGLEEEGISCD